MTVKTLLLFVGMITFTVIANLLLKTGATSSAPGLGNLSHFLGWRIVLGLGSFAMAAGFYILILAWLPLNVAVSFAAAQYIAVIFAAAWILSEPISFPRWIGVLFIALGIIIVGWAKQ